MSNRFDSIGDVNRYLDSMPRFQTSGAAAANFSLDAIRAFCRGMGNPQDAVPAIHVAGTNGKGTTCHMIHAVCISAGCKTGLFTSPHLLAFNERFRINGVPMGDGDLLRFFRENARLTGDIPLTYFELSAAIAFWYFRDQKVDAAIIETGLGGRLDATNIVKPMCSVITSIGMDHADILGDTLTAIAREKAGIIKPGVPVVTGMLPDEAFRVVEHIAREKGAPLTRASALEPSFRDGRIDLRHPRYGRLELVCDLPGAVQARNAAITVAALDSVRERLPAGKEAIAGGIRSVRKLTGLAGRYEKLLPDRNWYFDGGHNTEALEHLMELVRELSGETVAGDTADTVANSYNATAVIALNRDKATDQVLGFYRAFKRVYYWPMEGERSASFARIRERIPDAVLIEPDSGETCGPISHLNREELVIFSGSFYFYPVVKRWLAIPESR
jgi:dihydrofolate synthase / folylpolyglutamate synthase